MTSAMGLFLAYMVGAIPTGYVVGRMVRRIDIRKHGSKNVGATNVFRVLGPRWGICVLIIDILKGFVAVAVLGPLFWGMGTGGDVGLAAKLAAGFAAISGHNWTCWLNFKGGKGVATTCGVFLAIAPEAALSALAVWLVTVFVTKYVSVSSLLAAATCPLWVYLYNRGGDDFRVLFGISVLIPVLIAYTHRANIGRLLSGTESKITDKSKRV